MATKKTGPRHRWPRGMQIQSLVFDRSRYGPREARSWASSHGYKAPATERLPTTLRLRQKPKSFFSEGTYRTIRLRGGVQATVAVPKKKMVGRKRRRR